MKTRILLLLALLVVPTLAQAQTTCTAPCVVNPNYFEFGASPDHNAMQSDGVTPVVREYELRLSLEGTTATGLITVNLGKPTPGANNLIAVPVSGFAAQFAQLQASTATTTVRYTAIVAAVGASGVGVTGPSNPFVRAPLLVPGNWPGAVKARP